MINYIIKFFILLFCLNQSILCQTIDIFPNGWSITEEKNYNSENLQFFKGNIPNHIEADFNGDKNTDHAYILINQNKNKFALFVRLGNEKELIKLEEYRIENNNYIIYMGISIVKPGKYKTACGKGYWDCEPDEPDEIVLLNPSINFYLFESANSFFYWDDTIGRFKRIWISD